MVLVVVVIHLRLLVTEMKMAKDYNEGVYTNFVSARYVFFFFLFSYIPSYYYLYQLDHTTIIKLLSPHFPNICISFVLVFTILSPNP